MRIGLKYIFIGAGDNTVLPGEPDIGPTANVVVRLSQSIPEFQNHILYFDNFYTSLPLLVYLRAKGIFSLGTIRSNRIPNSKLPSEKDEEYSVSSRGYSVEYVGAAYGVDISTVTWKDNRAVRLASTYVGVMPFLKTNPTAVSTKLPRYDRKKKSYIEVDCPQIIKEYSTHMGGVDLMDGLMGRYHIRLKTRNPMSRIFYHFLDMAVTNAYILYHRVNPSDKVNLPDFREKIACGLCSFSLPKKVGRPSTTSCQPTTSHGKRCVRPKDDIRFDNTGHIPAMFDKSGKRRCKYCKQSDTQIYCSKCEINLCLTPNKNCFKEFHSK